MGSKIKPAQGLNTVFKIGKSKSDKSEMDCREDLDRKEISDDQVMPLKPLKATDTVFSQQDEYPPETMGFMTTVGKCTKVLQLGTEGGTPWLSKASDNLNEVDFEALKASLDDSNERAWWLRKCCAISAGFNRGT